MKILVTGGSGFIGKRLVKKLSDAGENVVVFGREDDIDRPDNVPLMTGNITDKIALRHAFSGVDIVYHLAASVDEEDTDMERVNVKGTENVVELCKERKVKHLVYMSSSGVLGETKVPAKENLPYNPQTRYEKTKAEAEKIIKHSGVTYTIVRAPIIIGPNAVWAKIFEAAKRGYPIIGTGKNKLHLAYVDDVVNLLFLVRNHTKAKDQVFHVAAKDVMTYEDVYRTICQELKVSMTQKKVPIKAALAMSHIHNVKSIIKGEPTPLHLRKSSIERLVRNRVLSIQKAKDTLGFQPHYTTPSAIHETVKYLQISRLGYNDYDLANIGK